MLPFRLLENIALLEEKTEKIGKKTEKTEKKTEKMKKCDEMKEGIELRVVEEEVDIKDLNVSVKPALLIAVHFILLRLGLNLDLSNGTPVSGYVAYVYIHIYIYIRQYVCICLFIYIRIFINIHIHICVYMDCI
jgi:hypothetical protein